MKMCIPRLMKRGMLQTHVRASPRCLVWQVCMIGMYAASHPHSYHSTAAIVVLLSANLQHSYAMRL